MDLEVQAEWVEVDPGKAWELAIGGYEARVDIGADGARWQVNQRVGGTYSESGTATLCGEARNAVTVAIVRHNKGLPPYQG